MTLPSSLMRILAHKTAEVSEQKHTLPSSVLLERIATLPPPWDVLARLRGVPSDGLRSHIIAEIKQASPSRGILRKDLDVSKLAQDYAVGGAAMISVLTDQRFFGGSFERLQAVRSTVPTPLLCKEFVIDPWQILRARAAGADAVLLIVSALSSGQLDDLYHVALEHCMTPLIEVHDATELDIAIRLGAQCIGINNRNLHTFVTDLRTSANLGHLIPKDRIGISESGIQTREHVEVLESHGFSAFLVGESLVTSENPAQQLRILGGAGA